MAGLIVDLFAGGGGASLGMTQAIGRSPDIAINHDADAIAMHEANHPTTKHYQCDVFEIHPLMATGGLPVDVLWASPSCTHFSRARAGVPKSEQMRTQPYVVSWWARYTRPKIIFVENVSEITTWGPLDENGYPDKNKEGRSFDLWIHSLKRYGYRVEWRILTASEYGAPTTRTRFFLIARCDGLPITWPEATHAAPDHWDVINGEKEPEHTTADIIDWDDLGNSIFITPEEVKVQGLRCKRPLAQSTMLRIAKGLEKYVLDNSDPFLIHIQHSSNPNGTVSIHRPMPTVTARPKGGGMALVTPFLAKHYSGVIGQRIDKPLSTVTAIDHHSLVSPTLIQMGYGDPEGRRSLDLKKPLGTVTAGGGKFAIASAFIKRDFGQSVGASLKTPLPTVTSGGGGHSALATAFMTKLRGTNIGYSMKEPMQTVSAKGQHHAAVSCIIEYYGTGTAHDLRQPMKTATTKDRFALVTGVFQTARGSDTIFVVTATGICFRGGPIYIDGEMAVIMDIWMRMLFPRELFRGQGFPDTYEIEHGANGRKLSTKTQVEKAGNAVPPQMSKALTITNYVNFYMLQTVGA